MTSNDFKAGLPSDRLREDEPVAGKFGDEAVVLVRHAGKVCALAGTCTHLGAPMEKGVVVGGELRCPWHHARFSLETGEAVGAPAFEPLQRFEVVETDGQVRVKGKNGTSPAPSANPDLGRVVIVGGGAAGHACADMLARAGAGGQVMLISADSDAPYDRTFCSKQYLAGKTQRGDAALPTPGLGCRPAPNIRIGVEISSIDPDRGSVKTAGGEDIGYDILVLATGAVPVVTPFAGSERDDVHCLRSLADADALIAAAKNARSAIILGSSYIGLEVAASLVQRGLTVTVVSEGDVPLEKTAGSEVGAFVQTLHEKKGVVFHMGRKIERWDGKTATLDDGTTIAGDMVVAGTGVEPRIELAKAAGLALADEQAGGGVSVDAQFRTSVDGIYAIGDIASIPDPRLGYSIRVEHWVVAQRMGQWLARHLLGQIAASYRETPFFWSGHYDTSLRYIGHVATPDERRIDGDILAADFAVSFREKGADQALLTCARDVQSLETEASWERTA